MHLIYITFPTKDEAAKIATMLIKERLAPCTNIYNGVTSIYEWEGKIQQTEEVTLICKTADALVDKLIKKVTKEHSYDCPCVIAIKIDHGNEDFLKWVETYPNLDY